MITPAGTTIDIAADGATGEDRVTLTPAFRFAYASPTQRVFLVDGPVTYLCDTVAGTLLRYRGYTVAANQAAAIRTASCSAPAPRRASWPNQLVGCAFTYTPGTAERAGLVSLQTHRQRAGRVRSRCCRKSTWTTCHDARRARQGGFSLVSAVFLLVVLAGLGVYAVRIGDAAAADRHGRVARRAGVPRGEHRGRVGRVSRAERRRVRERHAELSPKARRRLRMSRCSARERRTRKAAATIRVFVFDVRAEGGRLRRAGLRVAAPANQSHGRGVGGMNVVTDINAIQAGRGWGATRRARG